jgi:hypothetical protein
VIWLYTNEEVQTIRRIALSLAVLVLLALPAGASAYPLHHPHHERCHVGYVRHVEHKHGRILVLCDASKPAIPTSRPIPAAPPAATPSAPASAPVEAPEVIESEGEAWLSFGEDEASSV